jgi:hypothetical protein
MAYAPRKNNSYLLATIITIQSYQEHQTEASNDLSVTGRKKGDAMTSAITIYKQDGTRQCEDIKPRPIDVDAKIISGLGLKIIDHGRHERLPIFTPALCGFPTAWANVFAIDRNGVTRQQLFQLSQHGFKVWEFSVPSEPAQAKALGEDPFPLLQAAASLLASDVQPDRIADLVGYVIRVYKTGDVLTQDYRRDRVNFETDPTNHRIVRYWFG